MTSPRSYPVDAKLALHLIDWLMDHGFDPASSKTLRKGEGEGHAVAYVHRRVMDAEKPIPVVPVFLNTYFAPNQPRPKRCYELGRAIREAVETFPADMRVGIIASGGLSYFLVDEDFDRAILKACADKDAKFLQNLPRNKLNAGSVGNPQLGRHRRRLRASRPQLVRICPGLPDTGGNGHRAQFRELGVTRAYYSNLMPAALMTGPHLS